MCLTIRGIKNETALNKLKKYPKIATEDIQVFKLLKASGYPLYQTKFKYEKGNHYYQKGHPFTFGTYRDWDDNIVLEISEGLHAFKNLTRAQRCKASWHNIRIIKMIVPKGAKYYLGNDEDIVSDQLIFPH